MKAGKKAIVTAAKKSDQAVTAAGRSAGHAMLHPSQTLRGAGQAVKTATVGAAVGYVGWEKLTSDKSVARIVSDAVIGESATNAIAGVPDGVRELIRRDAEQICVGKRAGEHSVPQHDTNQMLVDAAKAGKTVVRLKGGDPFIFGRGGEELQAAAEAGIPFQVVPGITAASAVTAYAGIPLTHRDYAQSVTFVTGHYKADSTPFDWSHLAQSRQTLAIYMGTMKAADISEQLIQHGRESTTPVAVISRGTRVDQHVATSTLEHLATLAKDAPMPALIVVGEVVQLHSTLAWFQHTTDTEGFGSSVVNLA